MSTITITFGDQAENHVGMQKIGEMANEGFTLDDLLETKELFENDGAKCKLIHLNKYLDNDIDDAYVLIIRNAVEYLTGNLDGIYEEQLELNPDKKALMYGRVVNKNARYNLCFDKKGQKANYEEGKGTIIAYKKVPLLHHLRKMLPVYFGEKAKRLTAEGNYYYDITKCGIGFHGDAERKKVIAMRLGETLPLHYQWFYQSQPIGKRCKLKIHHGDIYVMSEKATGNDWKKKNTYTLRHAAGAPKFLSI